MHVIYSNTNRFSFYWIVFLSSPNEMPFTTSTGIKGWAFGIGQKWSMLFFLGMKLSHCQIIIRFEWPKLGLKGKNPPSPTCLSNIMMPPLYKNETLIMFSILNPLPWLFEAMIKTSLKVKYLEHNDDSI